MSSGELRLVIFVPVPIEAEPAHAVEDRLDRRLGGAGAVGVLDAEQELATVMAGEEPVEQGGARAADMEEAGRRRREAGDDPASFRRGCAQAPKSPQHGPWRPVTLARLAWGMGLAIAGAAVPLAPALGVMRVGVGSHEHGRRFFRGGRCSRIRIPGSSPGRQVRDDGFDEDIKGVLAFPARAGGGAGGGRAGPVPAVASGRAAGRHRGLVLAAGPGGLDRLHRDHGGAGARDAGDGAGQPLGAGARLVRPRRGVRLRADLVDGGAGRRAADRARAGDGHHRVGGERAAAGGGAADPHRRRAGGGGAAGAGAGQYRRGAGAGRPRAGRAGAVPGVPDAAGGPRPRRAATISRGPPGSSGSAGPGGRAGSIC